MMNYNNSQVICKTFKFAFFSNDEEALEALRSYLYALYKEKKPLAFFSPLSVLPSFVQDEITNCSGKLIGPPSERFFFMDMNRKHHMKLKIELDIDEVLDHLNIKDKVQYRYMMESVDTDDFINTDLEEKKFFSPKYKMIYTYNGQNQVYYFANNRSLLILLNQLFPDAGIRYTNLTETIEDIHKAHDLAEPYISKRLKESPNNVFRIYAFRSSWEDK